MISVALRGLAGRKLRSALTALAIVLGVSMISGTYVLTDTIHAAFSSIFTQSYRNADAVITGKVAFTDRNNNASQTPSFPQALLARVSSLHDVAGAAGGITDARTRLIDRSGKATSSGGAPNLAFSVDPHSDQRFNPLSLVGGSWPRGPGELAIDEKTASEHHYGVGDTIGAEASGPVRRFRIAGIVRFAGVSSIGGATIAVFDLPTAQRFLGKEGKLDIIRVQSRSGVATSRLLRELAAILPPTAQVRSAAAQAKEDLKGVAFIGIIQKILLAFGGIALFVGAFVIANTLSITIAQRVREFATLRTLGASRRQVLWSVVLEALVIAVIGSVAGLFLGLALAKGLNWVFVQAKIDLPQAATIFAARTIIVSLVVGIVITLLASLRPALRATRVPPIAAVREGSVLPPSRFARFGPATALLVLLVGVGLLAYGTLGHHIPITVRLVVLAAGVLLLFLGVALNAPRLVPPLASVLGWPARRLGGAAGALARQNAMRNPARTAATASALMIGLALVTFVAILGAGLRSSFESSVNKLFVANYAITSANTFTPMTTAAERSVVGVRGVVAVTGIRAGSGKYLGSVHNLTGVNSNLSQTIHLDWKEGSAAVPAELGAGGAFVDDSYANKHHLHVGTPLAIEVPTGQTLHVRILGVFHKPKGGSPFGEATISSALFDRYFPRPQNEMVLVDIRGGASAANTALLQRPLQLFPDAKVQTESEFKKNFEKPITSLLNLLYVLLALSVVISLFGIVNTLVLTVFERTRELGMLRAIGMTRRQTRRMIRHESIVTSLIGALLGVGVGIFLAALVTHALSSQGFVFALPWGTLIRFLLAAILVGNLAAILPARRAARLNVLRALQYE